MRLFTLWNVTSHPSHPHPLTPTLQPPPPLTRKRLTEVMRLSSGAVHRTYLFKKVLHHLLSFVFHSRQSGQGMFLSLENVCETKRFLPRHTKHTNPLVFRTGVLDSSKQRTVHFGRRILCVLVIKVETFTQSTILFVNSFSPRPHYRHGNPDKNC